MELETERFIEAAEYIKARIKDVPQTAVILGGGLDSLIEEMSEKVIMSYNEVPHFVVPTIKDHTGELVYGNLNYTPVLILNGRCHYYEGYTLSQITFPIRVFSKLGIKNLIFINRAGGINLNYIPGDLMVIKDHINFSDLSPLRGKNLDEFGPRFPKMLNSYDKNMILLAEQLAGELGINVNEGVYAFMQGPNFETESEIKALRLLGADAVGMSTVPEVIVAKHCGLKTLAISYISDMAAGIQNIELTNDEILEIAELVKNKIISWIKLLVTNLYVKTKDNEFLLYEGKGYYLDGDNK